MEHEDDLKREQWHQLAERMRAVGFDVADFDRCVDGMGWTSSDDTPVLKHRGSNYFFQFLTPDGFRQLGYGARFSPGREVLISRVRESPWPSILSQFQDWLVLLKRDLAIVDPWARAAKVREVVAERVDRSAPELDGPFSSEEADSIQEVLGRVEKRLSEFSTFVEHQPFISAQISFLVDEARTTANRGTWRRHLETGLVSWCITLGMNLTQMETVCREVFGWFSGLVHLGWKAVKGLVG